jgi:hypothetical protein
MNTSVLIVKMKNVRGNFLIEITKDVIKVLDNGWKVRDRMSFEDDMFDTFLVFGYICLLPFLMALGVVAYPIIVGMWINDYIKSKL